MGLQTTKPDQQALKENKKAETIGKANFQDLCPIRIEEEPFEYVRLIRFEWLMKVV